MCTAHQPCKAPFSLKERLQSPLYCGPLRSTGFQPVSSWPRWPCYVTAPLARRMCLARLYVRPGRTDPSRHTKSVLLYRPLHPRQRQFPANSPTRTHSASPARTRIYADSQGFHNGALRLEPGHLSLYGYRRGSPQRKIRHQRSTFAPAPRRHPKRDKRPPARFSSYLASLSSRYNA